MSKKNLIDKNKDYKKTKSRTELSPAELRREELEKKAESAGNEAFRVSKLRTVTEISVLVLSALIYVSAFPPLNWTFAAWFAIAPLYFIVREKKFCRAFIYGFIWGYIWSCLSFSWLREIEPFIPFLMAFVLALFPALWASAVSFLRHGLLIPNEVLLQNFEKRKKFYKTKFSNEIIFLFCLSAWWTCIEWIRSWVASGLPWNFISATQWKNIPLIQICEYTGVYGVIFLMLCINISVGMAFDGWFKSLPSGRYKRPHALMLSIILVMTVIIAGSKLSIKYKQPNKNANAFTAGVIQGNIEQMRFPKPGQAEKALKTYLNLSKELMDKYDTLSRITLAKHKAKGKSDIPPADLGLITGLDLIIWPESAVPLPVRYAEDYYMTVQKIIKKYRIPMLIGSIDYEKINDDEFLQYGSAFLFNESGNISSKYDKIHIVPFGEFVPFEKYFPFLTDWMGMGRSLSPGKSAHPIILNENIRAGINICFEDVFPYVSRKEVLNGANLIIVISNDAWYPKSSEPEQHLANAVFRAVETRLPVIRSGNNSGSCLINPNGIISDSVDRIQEPGKENFTPAPEIKSRGTAIFTAMINPENKLTFYTKYGNIFVWFCWGIFLSGLIWAILQWKSRKEFLISLVSADTIQNSEERA